jgi:hypothetical protein
MMRNRIPMAGSRALVALAAAGALLAVAPAAGAKVSPPEDAIPDRGQQWEWVDGPMHEAEDPCSENGPWAEAAEACGDEESDGADADSGPVWGGPGERVAVGRDPDAQAAQDEAEDEADDVCHGDWALRDFDWDISMTGPTVYTLTYECS